MVIFLKNYSIWNDEVNFIKRDKLDKNINVDILVIGGGITGISCCFQLIGTNKKIALVDANSIGSGITSRTTGKLTFLQEGIYSKIKKYSNANNAKLYYEAQKDSIKIVKDIVTKEKINCNFEKSDSYLFCEDESKINNIKNEKKILENFGCEVKEVDSLPDKNKCGYGIKVDGTYCFHPLKYLVELEKVLLNRGVKIYENTRIYSINEFGNYYICKSDKYSIHTKEVVLALHYPYFTVPFFMPFKVHLEKSYVSAFLEKNNLNFNAINLDKPVKSVRFYKSDENKYKIFLYGSRNLAMDVNDKKHFDKFKEFNYDYKYLWSNIDIITGDFIPYIGEIMKGVYIATGYNTWGMTNSSIAAVVIRDLILKKENKYINLFNPKRGINILSLPLVFGSNAKSYIESTINSNKKFYESVRIEEINGKKIGIYNYGNKEYKVYIKCPHMGCNLVFNEVEKTWDCPCHGSRFNIYGKVINGPSNFAITYK